MKWIVFFGDSLTAGYGLKDVRNEAFPWLIARKIDDAKLNYQVVNAGISGDTTTAGLQRLGAALRPIPDIFVLALGANDMLRGYSPATIKGNLQSIIDRVKAKNPAVQILLLGMQLPAWVPGQLASGYRSIFSEVALANQLKFVPFLLEGVAGMRHLNLADGIHPSREGYKIIAEKVWTALEPMLL